MTNVLTLLTISFITLSLKKNFSLAKNNEKDLPYSEYIASIEYFGRNKQRSIRHHKSRYK